jgi:hypothetical protein
VDNWSARAAQSFYGRKILLDHNERQLALSQEASQHGADTAVAEQHSLLLSDVGVINRTL